MRSKGDLSEKRKLCGKPDGRGAAGRRNKIQTMQNSFMEIRAILKRGENGHAHRNRCTHQIKICKTADRAEMDSCKRLNGSVHRHGLEAERGRIRACDKKMRRQNPGGRPAWGGSGSVTYQVKTLQKIFMRKMGRCCISCSCRGHFAGKAGGVLQVNRFFEDWKNEKLRIYEADGDSIRQAALEIYRESKDSGWTGSWTERYRVSRVCTKGQYVSVLLDSDLKEGNLKKNPAPGKLCA